MISKHCHRCNEVLPLIEKMGGFICSKCRIVLATTHTALWKEYRKENAAKAQEQGSGDLYKDVAQFGAQKTGRDGLK